MLLNISNSTEFIMYISDENLIEIIEKNQNLDIIKFVFQNKRLIDNYPFGRIKIDKNKFNFCLLLNTYPKVKYEIKTYENILFHKIKYVKVLFEDKIIWAAPYYFQEINNTNAT